ncbi:hypothetical protein FRC04_011904 [Tulasnella sp. 424]|nr:hypothetical protein FRC04_011904 [Tulasnella sp. 424]KAG8967004.1 hypothetical protein FRC05_002318 [Tulasnella sp. 425]
MHPFWELQDVVSEVILLLSKADMTRVARVNKRLWELTIPHLWRHVPNFRQFFNLFPSDLWIRVKFKSVSPPALERELQDSDWSRFLFHSKTTKSIDYSVGSLLHLVPLEVLSHPLLPTSFPSLERLSVGVLSTEEGPTKVIPLLLRPSLRSVGLDHFSANSNDPLVGLLETISESRTFSLEEMSFSLPRSLDHLKGVETRAIASQTCLRRLTIRSLADITEMVEIARSLPFLEELEVGKSKVYSRFPKQDIAAGFRSLTTLVVGGVPAEIQNLLRSIGSGSLARVALRLINPRHGAIYPALVAEMQRFKSHLLNLHLDLRVPFTWEDLEPALALAELQAFGLTYLVRSSESQPITDARLRQMVDSWPHLTQLRLISKSTATLRVTLSSLAYIASNRPNMRKLAITFEARQAMNPEFSDKVDVSKSSENGLELFDVVGSVFDEGDEGRLADTVFRLWWPRARFCESDSLSNPRSRWEIDDAPSWPRGER